MRPFTPEKIWSESMQFPFGSPKRVYFQRVFGLGFDAFISNLHSYSAHLVQQMFCYNHESGTKQVFFSLSSGMDFQNNESMII